MAESPVFLSGKQNKIQDTGIYRPLERKDENNSIAIIGQVVKTIFEFEDLRTKVADQINSIKSTLNIQAESLVAENKPLLDDNATERTLSLQSGEVSLNLIANEREVLEKNNYAESNLELTFSNTSVSTQDFAIEVKIKDGQIEKSKQITAKLKPEEVIIEGVYISELQTKAGKTLNIKVKFHTKSGAPLKDENVKFSLVKGKGSFSLEDSKTNLEGIALTELQIAEDNNSNIEIKATIYNNAGEMVKDKIFTITRIMEKFKLEYIDRNNQTYRGGGKPKPMFFKIKDLDKNTYITNLNDYDLKISATGLVTKMQN